MSRSKNFCFTLNNYSEEELESVSKWDCKYLIVGKEVGESGTPHLQGFIVFKETRTLSVLKKKLSDRAHWEIMRGTPQQAAEYCKKDGNFAEIGVAPLTPAEKGAKGGTMEKDRWDDILSLAEAGDWESLKIKHAEVYVNKLKALEYVNKKRKKIIETLDGEMEHQWLYGPPGTGKSLQARKENPGAFIKDPKTKWWDGYNGEETVIIDDFDKYQVSQGGDMKRWMDRYAFQAEFKGGYEVIRPKKIIVTSNYHPSDIWEDEITVNAVLRRTEVRHFTELKKFDDTVVLRNDCYVVKKKTEESWKEKREKESNQSLEDSGFTKNCSNMPHKKGAQVNWDEEWEWKGN